MVGLRVAVAAIAFCVCAAAAQKHQKISTADRVAVDLAADSIETDSAPASSAGQSPVVIHLKGKVEIRMRWADGSPERLVIHADAAEFHEDTGEVQAHGNVTMTPVKEPDAADAPDKPSN